MINFFRATQQRGLHQVPDVRRERPHLARPLGHLPGHGPVALLLLHQLQPQLLPHREAVRRKVQRRDLPTGFEIRVFMFRC